MGRAYGQGDSVSNSGGPGVACCYRHYGPSSNCAGFSRSKARANGPAHTGAANAATYATAHSGAHPGADTYSHADTYTTAAGAADA